MDGELVESNNKGDLGIIHTIFTRALDDEHRKHVFPGVDVLHHSGEMDKDALNDDANKMFDQKLNRMRSKLTGGQRLYTTSLFTCPFLGVSVNPIDETLRGNSPSDVEPMILPKNVNFVLRLSGNDMLSREICIMGMTGGFKGMLMPGAIPQKLRAEDGASAADIAGRDDMIKYYKENLVPATVSFKIHSISLMMVKRQRPVGKKSKEASRFFYDR